MIYLECLTHAVQVKRAKSEPWETIAAFDHPIAAGNYARECQAGALRFVYRVVSTKTGKPLKPLNLARLAL